MRKSIREEFALGGGGGCKEGLGKNEEEMRRIRGVRK